MSRPSDREARQSQDSVNSNAGFFRDSTGAYRHYIETLDTYAAIRSSVNAALAGPRRGLDVGNGGVFDYDVQSIPDLTAMDLFLHQLPRGQLPEHVRGVSGSALSLPFADASFDLVVINMLLHHLVGQTVSESRANVQTALREAARVLEPGGRLVLVESCVPRWFYRCECAAFAVASRIINLITSHPVTLQFPPETVAALVGGEFERLEVTRIPKGRWVLQYARQSAVAADSGLSLSVRGRQRSTAVVSIVGADGE